MGIQTNTYKGKLHITKSEVDASLKAMDDKARVIGDAYLREWIAWIEKEIDGWLIRFGLTPPCRKGVL